MTKEAGGRARDGVTVGSRRSSMISRVASAGALALLVAALGSLCLASAADVAGLVPALLSLFGAVHLALIAVASWRFGSPDEGVGDVQGGDPHRAVTGIGTIEPTSRATGHTARIGLPASTSPRGAASGRGSSRSAGVRRSADRMTLLGFATALQRSSGRFAVP